MKKNQEEDYEEDEDYDDYDDYYDVSNYDEGCVLGGTGNKR